MNHVSVMGSSSIGKGRTTVGEFQPVIVEDAPIFGNDGRSWKVL